MKAQTYLRWTLSLVLAALFAWSSCIKLIAPADFAEAVYRYQILPAAAINLCALWLPWVELSCALALVLPRWRLAASTTIFGMLMVFTAAIISTLVRDIDISCGCFSVSPEASRAGVLNIVRNAAMLTVAGSLAVLEFRARLRSADHSPS